jgi:catabolite regulation protein CreA
VTVKEGKLPANEVVFGVAGRAPFFKEVRVSRLDGPRRSGWSVYLVWSTISLGTGGSAFNSVTAVPLDR